MRRLRHVPALLAALLLAMAPAWGGPDLKSYPASDFKDPAYHRALHNKVGASWARPAQGPKAGSKAVVIVTILRDGTLMEPPRLHMKSGSEAWDQSAMDAVKKASPFDPLPKGYARTSLEVHFHFELN